MNSRKTRVIGATAALVVAVSGMALAGSHGGGKATAGVVKERQEVMKVVRDNFVPLVKMVKGAAPFDAQAVKRHAATLAAELERARKLFPAGSDKGETRAKPEIWQMNDEFMAIFKTSVEKAKAIGAVSSADQLPAAVMALGGQGCKACHEKFRKPKDM